MLYHVFTETRPKPLLIIIVSLSIFLTVSGTAIILLLLIVFMTYAKDRFFALIFASLAYTLLVFSDVFSSRGLEILTDSYATCVDILDVISSSNILPQSFGLGTATSYFAANAFDLI